MTSSNQRQSTDVVSPSRPTSLAFQLTTFFAARTVENTGYRMFHAFLPVIARSLGIEQIALTQAITLRSALGLLGPFIGSVADGWGRRLAMLLGFLLFTASMVAVFILPTYPVLLIALVMTGITKMLFDPALYAYLGDRVPFQKRGLAVAIVEVSWSGAFLIGIPISGWLIANAGWSSPFLFLGLLGAGIVVILWWTVPTDTKDHHLRPSLKNGIGIILRNKSALAAISVGVLISTSNEVVNITYAAWLENNFGFQVPALAGISALIGIAELVGEGGVAALSDRLGKRRALGLGLGIYAVMALLLPVFGTTPDGARVGLFLFYLSFEFAIVASLPLMIGLVPEARATLMAGNGAGHALGRMIGSVIGPALFTLGISTNAVFAAVLNIIALVALIWFVREHHGTPN